MTIHTNAVAFKADSKLIDFINAKLTKLEQLFDRIIDARVVLKLENSGQVRDKIAEVRINLPGHVLIAKESHKTFEASIDATIDNLKRQIKRYKTKQQAKRK
ncbi:MAG: putative sigma-54 modulation protein [Saprospiraceae bacterium]|jgi:putative sigma-54 modulation protein